MVEGEKSVIELINSELILTNVFATPEWIKSNASTLNIPITEASKVDLERMSFFKTASPVIATAKQPENRSLDLTQKWILALDGINDPGNLGTIIRIADWYGISQIYCSPTTVDQFNPKTISSTMGSFTRVSVQYLDLVELLKSTNKTAYFTLMEGESIYKTAAPSGGIIVIGSEANGISNELMSIPHNSITIPRVGNAESLNAAVATGIICDRLTQ